MAGLIVLGACSFVDKSSRPDASAEDNVRCVLDYRPELAEAGGPDLIFVAWSSPYREEEFMLSLPDVAIHSLFAPGRHLQTDLVLEGAECNRPLWKKGFRLPRIPNPEKLLSCRRRGSAAVSFSLETKWGKCDLEIPAGDLSPRPDPWLERWMEMKGLRRDSPPGPTVE